jgi:alpha-beta hydrolase superfamily lysophospholipase
MKISSQLRDMVTLPSLALVATVALGACGAAPNDDTGAPEQSISASEACKTTFAFDKKYERIVRTSTFTGADGLPVRYRVYGKLGKDKAAVVFLQGRSEFIEKYDVLFTSLHEFPVGDAPADQTLADLPITFVAIDHEGQGASAEGRLAAHIDDFSYYVDDIDKLFDRVPELGRHKTPVFLMAHSMGGLIAARYAQEHPDKIKGLILGSPMLGHLAPPPLTAEQLAGVAAFYAAPQPYGLGLPKLCTSPAGITPDILVAIAAVHSDATLRGCFYDSTQPVCGMLTQCLLYGLPNDCGLPAIDFAGLYGALTYLQSLPDGCPPRQPSCPDPALGTDEAYCNYTEHSPLWTPDPTFGWLNQGFLAQAAFAAGSAINVPTLILSDPNDHVVDASKHVCAAPFAGECNVVQFPNYGHELFATGERANAIAQARQFLLAHMQ